MSFSDFLSEIAPFGVAVCALIIVLLILPADFGMPKDD